MYNFSAIFYFPILEPELEECPKWTALVEVLEEIKQENEERQKDGKDDDPGRVLVAAADDRTCNQIKEVSVT